MAAYDTGRHWLQLRTVTGQKQLRQQRELGKVEKKKTNQQTSPTEFCLSTSQEIIFCSLKIDI